MRKLTLLLSLLIMTTGTLFAKNNNSKNKEVITKIFDYKGFDEVSISFASVVDVNFSETYSVEIEATAEQLNSMNLSLEHGKLSFAKKLNWENVKSKGIKISINLPILNELDLTAVNSLKIKGMKQEKFELNIAGTTDAFIDAELDKCSFDLAGSAEIAISGKSKKFKVNAAGLNEINALDFLVEDFSLRGAGYSTSRVNVQNEINVKIAGGSKVRYLGNPKVTSQRVIGFGSIRKLNQD